MLTSREIRATAFEVVRKGYSVADVDSFLRKVADQLDALQTECANMLKEKDSTIESLEKELSSQENKMLILAEKLEEYRSQENLLQNALLNAEKIKESVIGEARQTGEILLRDAQQKADKILESTNRRVATEQQNYFKLQREVAEFKNSVLDLYKSHLTLISSIPDEVEEIVDTEPVAAVDEPVETNFVEESVVDEVVETVEDAAEAVEEVVSDAEEAAAEAVEETEAVVEEKYDGFAPRSMTKNDDEETTSSFGQLDFGDKFTFGN